MWFCKILYNAGTTKLDVQLYTQVQCKLYTQYSAASITTGGLHIWTYVGYMMVLSIGLRGQRSTVFHSPDCTASTCFLITDTLIRIRETTMEKTTTSPA